MGEKYEDIEKNQNVQIFRGGFQFGCLDGGTIPGIFRTFKFPEAN